jgi:hypothetical protein
MTGMICHLRRRIHAKRAKRVEAISVTGKSILVGREALPVRGESGLPGR